MVDAAHVDLPLAVRGTKHEDAGDLADPNEQAGHSPPEATARGILAKGGHGMPVNEGRLNEEKAGGGVSKPEAAGSTPKKQPQEGTPRKKAQDEGTFVFRVDRKRAKAAKIAMVDAARVDLPVAVRGAKCKDVDNLADPNEQAGHSPPEATARGILPKSGRGTPVDEGGSNKENPKIARGKILAYGQVGEGRRRETASTIMGPAPNLGHGRNMATPNNAVALAAAETAPAVWTKTAVRLAHKTMGRYAPNTAARVAAGHAPVQAAAAAHSDQAAAAAHLAPTVAGLLDGSQWDWASDDDDNEAHELRNLHASGAAGLRNNEHAGLDAHQEAEEDAHSNAPWTATYMAHLSDGTYNAQGWGASAASPETPKSCAVTARSGQKDHKEAQRKPPRAANKEANWKTEYNIDHGRRAATPDYADDWDLGWLGVDVEFEEARKASDNPKDEADKDSASNIREDDNRIKVIASRDLAALDALAENRSIRGTMAARLAWGVHKAEAAPGWSGIGADYKAWVEALYQAPGNPEAALNPRAPGRAYLAILNGTKHFLVLHHLHRWKAPEGARSCFEGCIVAFEGEVRDEYGLPLLWRFKKDNENLLQLAHLPEKLSTQAASFYRRGDWDKRFHNRAIPPPPEWLGETVTTLRGLVPIPVGWPPYSSTTRPWGRHSDA
jgi:hypothetical protein